MIVARAVLLALTTVSIVVCSEQQPATPADVIGNRSTPPAAGSVPETTLKTTAAEKRAELRKRAKTDPGGADAEAIADMSRYEVVATAINSAGYLCARVRDVQLQASGVMIVQCTMYRSGKGKVRYRVDANEGRVTELSSSG